MTRPLSILFAGESWTTATTHVKGLDHFTQYGYGEGVRWVKAALEAARMTVTHLPCHRALTDFPATPEALAAYDAVILSDIGSNTLLLHPDTTQASLPTPNRLKALRDYVRNGGAVLMIGGYMSFAGIEAKAKYYGSPVEELLPVTIQTCDDRVEVPEGFRPRVVDTKAAAHPVLQGLPAEFPPMLFYNRVSAKTGATSTASATSTPTALSTAEVLMTNGADPILVVGQYGLGRSAAFLADCAPHGATPEFLNWSRFNRFWSQLLLWLCAAEAHEVRSKIKPALAAAR